MGVWLLELGGRAVAPGVFALCSSPRALRG